MPQGLSVSDLVNVGIVLSPTAAGGRNFSRLLIIGSSPVIDTTERSRDYTTLEAVAGDFGTATPEYLAAQAFFSQSPQPYFVKIGRWAQNASAGVLHGAPLSALEQAAALSAFQSVSTGTLTVPVDGTPRALAGLNFGGAANLNGVAGVINTALGAFASCTWNGSRFDITSGTTGTTSTVQFANTPSGVDLAGLMKIKSTSGGPAPVVGAAAETPVAAVQLFAALTGDFYAFMIVPADLPLTDSQVLAVAAATEGINPVHIFAHTLQNPSTLDPVSTTDLASLLHSSRYSRTLLQYSSTHAYAVASFLGRALAVNYEGSRTVITMMFKQEPGVIAEDISETQAATAKARGVNVYAKYQNGAAIIQHGVVSSGRYWDEVHGLDWLANSVQTDLFNVFYQSLTKIPQTDDGVHILLTQFEATLARAVENGLVAPGIWNQEGFGQIKRGDPLPKGFYVYAPLISTQSQADREARKSPMLQAAVKMAGAIHSVDTTISVNR